MKWDDVKTKNKNKSIEIRIHVNYEWINEADDLLTTQIERLNIYISVLLP